MEKFKIVEVHFGSEVLARQHAVTPLKTEDAVLLPIYLRKSASRIRLAVIAPDMDIAYLFTGVLLCM